MSGEPKKAISEEAIDQAKRLLMGVGYSRPPKEHQFRKGESGNPKGRPKQQDRGDRAAHSIALREAERLVTVREGDTVHQITQIDAVHRAQYMVATKGSAYAQKHIIERYERARRERLLEGEAENAIWRAYIQRQRDTIERATREGIVPDLELPHPDDVIIDPEKGVRFIGPWDEASAARLEETVRMRDCLLTQSVWDERHGRGEGDSRVTVAGSCALALNDAIPARLRLTDIQWIVRVSRLECTSKRELRKLLRRQWTQVGVRWSEDVVFPSIAQFRWDLEQLIAAYKQLEAGGDGMT